MSLQKGLRRQWQFSRTLKYMKSLIIILLLATCALAGTVQISDYATPNDGIDDSVGFQQAIDDLKADGGGTLMLGTGTWDISSRINVLNYHNGQSIVVKGNKESVIHPHQGQSELLFYVGNFNSFEVKDVIFVGDSMADYDVWSLVYSAYTSKVKIDGCEFYGIKASLGLIYGGVRSETVVVDSIFDGNAADIASIYAENSMGLTVKRSRFIDYGDFRGVYHSKSPSNIGAWIAASEDPADVNGLSNIGLIVESCRFDEAAPASIAATGLRNVLITQIVSNVNGAANGKGIHLDNVRFAKITQGQFGYTPFAKPAIYAINGTRVSVEGLTLGGGVTPYFADNSSSVNIAYCSNCPAETLTMRRPR